MAMQTSMTPRNAMASISSMMVKPFLFLKCVIIL